jgi:hypothetical protein
MVTQISLGFRVAATRVGSQQRAWCSNLGQRITNDDDEVAEILSYDQTRESTEILSYDYYIFLNSRSNA